MRRIAIAAVVVLTAIVAMGQSTAERGVDIAASSFRLLDQRGCTRAAFSLNGQDVTLCFHDEAGTVRTTLGLVKDQSFVQLCDRDGNGRALVHVTPAGPAVSLEAKADRSKAQLVLTDSGPGLALSDRDGVRRVGLFADVDGALLGFTDRQGLPRVGLGLSDDRPSLTLSDKSGKARAALGAATLEVSGAAGVKLPEESSLILLDHDGSTLYRAGK
jgi:hypothetical protein